MKSDSPIEHSDMYGRKPKPRNVIPLRGDGDPGQAELKEAAIRRAVATIRPRGLSPELRREWDRVATILAEPIVDRLKPRFVDVILEYCRLCVRLRALYAAFPNLSAETYQIKTRDGAQRKTDPLVGQRNETWRQWNSLRMALGLDPSSERNMLPGQGDLFDESDREFA
jgi:P27 family predicted phage terminase small subunit